MIESVSSVFLCVISVSLRMAFRISTFCSSALSASCAACSRVRRSFCAWRLPGGSSTGPGQAAWTLKSRLRRVNGNWSRGLAVPMTWWVSQTINEGGGRILGLAGQPAVQSCDELVWRAEGHLDGSDQRLVATDARLGDAPRDARRLGAASRHPGARRQRPGRPHRLAEFTLRSLLTLAAHPSASLREPCVRAAGGSGPARVCGASCCVRRGASGGGPPSRR